MFSRKPTPGKLEKDPLFMANLQIARGTPPELLRAGIQHWVQNRGWLVETGLSMGFRAPVSILAYEQALAEKTKRTSNPYKPMYLLEEDLK